MLGDQQGQRLGDQWRHQQKQCKQQLAEPTGSQERCGHCVYNTRKNSCDDSAFGGGLSRGSDGTRAQSSGCGVETEASGQQQQWTGISSCGKNSFALTGTNIKLRLGTQARFFADEEAKNAIKLEVLPVEQRGADGLELGPQFHEELA
ncbi:unnamed protein product [Linum trigynum]|uniref:Uncharacterized protein n=1 Tax=Linum trigynum TaxID=586398 RepID=A0AAV2DUV6_9ROSI